MKVCRTVNVLYVLCMYVSAYSVTSSMVTDALYTANRLHASGGNCSARITR